VLGQNADSERYAAAAVSTLETLGPGPELAMAYSNLAQLRMLADDNADALHWGTKAIALRLGGEDRPAGAPLAQPFALMLAGEHRAARPLREDRGSSRLRGAAQDRGADPVPGGRRRAAARGHRTQIGNAKMGNTPDVRHGPAGVS
jgi:hypothetical protein